MYKVTYVWKDEKGLWFREFEEHIYVEEMSITDALSVSYRLVRARRPFAHITGIKQV